MDFTGLDSNSHSVIMDDLTNLSNQSQYDISLGNETPKPLLSSTAAKSRINRWVDVV